MWREVEKVIMGIGVKYSRAGVGVVEEKGACVETQSASPCCVTLHKSLSLSVLWPSLVNGHGGNTFLAGC